MDAIKTHKVAEEKNTQEDKRLEERKRLFAVVERMADLGILLQVVKRSVH